MSKRDELALRDYLGHIQQAIERIRRYLVEIDHTAFLVNEEKQDAVIRNLELIGEAAGNIQRHFPEFSTQTPSSPLKPLMVHVMPWHTGTLKLTWMWSGKPLRGVCPC